MKKVLSYLITVSNIVVNYVGQTFMVNAGSDREKYDAVKTALKDGDDDKVISILVPREMVIDYSNEYFVVDDAGNVYMKDLPKVALPKVFAIRLYDFAKDGLPIEPLVNFWKRLRNNPLDTAIEDLYAFLEKNHHPITPDGHFIAYKRVNKTGKGRKIEYRDSHRGKYNNAPGKIVSMPREKVDADRNNTCSAGLHVASWAYAQTYSGNVLIEVIVNPEDVVSVPVDYDRQKMRVCRYQVIGEVQQAGARKEQLAKTDDRDLSAIAKVDPDAKNVSLINSDTHKAYTAKEIIELVEKCTGIRIEMSLKNKSSIVKKAVKLLTENGYNVTQ